MESSNLIEVQSLSKRYGDTVALDNISLSIRQGELYGLIGPDGAGKTTLFRILTTLLLPDSGSGTVLSWDVVSGYKEIRQHIGYMPGKFSLYQDLTVRENLELFATVYGTTVQENMETIRDIYTQIERFSDRAAGKLSGGMKQKLALCCALIHAPKVLFLDEPTTGVDPVSRREFWDILELLRRQGLTIIVSTPYMDEASRCDRIALIDRGRILDVDTPQGVVAKFAHQLYGVRADNMRTLLNTLRAMDEILGAYSFGEEVHITMRADTADLSLVPLHLHKCGYNDVLIRPIEATIENCFMYLSRDVEG